MAEKTKSAGKNGKSKAQSWFDGVKAEFNKIVWTDRPTLIKQTVVVCIVTVILGALISIMDAGILQFLNLLIK